MHRYAGSSEVPLAEEAEEQIVKLTEFMRNETVDAIYASPLTRCLQTIRPTAAHQHLRIIKLHDLIERNLGDWEGHTPEEIHLNHGGYHFPESAYDGSFRLHDSEPLVELEHRVRKAMREIVDAHPGQRVLVCTHGGVMLMIQARIVVNRPRHLHWPSNCAVAHVEAEDHHYRWLSIQEQGDYAPNVLVTA